MLVLITLLRTGTKLESIKAIYQKSVDFPVYGVRKCLFSKQIFHIDIYLEIKLIVIVSQVKTGARELQRSMQPGAITIQINYQLPRNSFHIWKVLLPYY